VRDKRKRIDKVFDLLEFLRHQNTIFCRAMKLLRQTAETYWTVLPKFFETCPNLWKQFLPSLPPCTSM